FPDGRCVRGELAPALAEEVAGVAAESVRQLTRVARQADEAGRVLRDVVAREESRGGLRLPVPGRHEHHEPQDLPGRDMLQGVHKAVDVRVELEPRRDEPNVLAEVTLERPVTALAGDDRELFVERLIDAPGPALDGAAHPTVRSRGDLPAFTASSLSASS